MNFIQLSVELPWPPYGLSPNGRLNRFLKAKLIKSARKDAYWLARKAMLQAGLDAPIHPGDNGVHVVYYCTPPTRARPDDDNMMGRLKAMRDGVADALGVNDRCFHTSVEFRPAQKPARVLMVLTWNPPLRKKK